MVTILALSLMAIDSVSNSDISKPWGLVDPPPLIGKELLVDEAALAPLDTEKPKGFFEWQSSNVQLLQGHNYKLGESDRSILSLEHAHGWAYGNNFAFLDITKPEGEQQRYYGEFAPRLSLGRLTDTSLAWGPVKDLYLVGNLEWGTGIDPRYLGGAGVELDVPGFRFLRLEAMLRDDSDKDGQTWQLTTVWNLPFKIAAQSFLFEGFLDWAGPEGGGSHNLVAAPRLLYDLGENWGRPGTCHIGVEYQLWYNKYGIEGVNEHVPQLMLKYSF
jgi:nucleoside-specific outer membrane channel protein Tsx